MCPNNSMAGCQCLEFLTCSQMLTHAIAHGGGMNTVKESTCISNLPEPTLNQLTYIPHPHPCFHATKHDFFFCNTPIQQLRRQLFYLVTCNMHNRTNPSISSLKHETRSEVDLLYHSISGQCWTSIMKHACVGITMHGCHHVCMLFKLYHCHTVPIPPHPSHEERTGLPGTCKDTLHNP